jgi:hypothetical protein
VKYIPQVDGNSFRMRRKPETLANRERAKKTLLTITCDTCAIGIYQVKAHTYNGAPATHFKLAEQGMRAHQRTTGCAGHDLDARRLVTAAAAAIDPNAVRLDTAAIDKLVGTEIDELAASLGIERDKAAEMIGSAIQTLRAGGTRQDALELLQSGAAGAPSSFEGLAAKTFNAPGDAGPGPWEKLARMTPAEQKAMHREQMAAAIAEGERFIREHSDAPAEAPIKIGPPETAT